MDFNKVISFNPGNVDAYLSGAAAYVLHDMNRAIADYSEAIRLNPLNSEAYISRGEAYKAMGDKKRANADFAKAKELSKFRLQILDGGKEINRAGADISK